MKISKQIKIASATNTSNVSTAPDVVIDDVKYADGVKYIKMAIDSLAACGKDDKLAKDCIANLSVVLFDLQ